MVDSWNAAVLNEAVANGSIGGGGSTTLSDLTDVNLTTPTGGDLLSYDGESSKWVNTPAPTPDAEDIGYDNTDSGLTATNTQDAIDEVNDKADNITAYSENEKVVGTWIDGKPLYQKTINCGALPNNTTKNSAHNISNMKSIIDFSCVANRSQAGFTFSSLILPFVNTSNTIAQVSVDDTNVILVTNADLSSYNATYVTIKYIKTTD